MRMVGSVNNEISCTNVEGDNNVVPANDGRTTKKKVDKSHDKLHITCHKCHKKGHYANECSGVNNDDGDDMAIHCNAGVTTTNLVSDLAGYGTVWYHPNGIANILSLSRVWEHGCRITYNSADGNRFIVSKHDGGTRIFEQSNRGLIYMDKFDHGVTMVNTVANNQSSYTKRDCSRAVLARKIQEMMGRPSTRDFLRYVDNNLLPNCPINRQDILAAEHIFGPDVG
jgi:hypothetical protein